MTLRWFIACAVLGAALGYVLFAERKDVALALSIPAVLISRWLVVRDGRAAREEGEQERAESSWKNPLDPDGRARGD